MMMKFAFWIVMAAIYGQVLSSRQEMMTNKHLRITHVPWPPFLTVKENVDGSVSLQGPIGEAIMFWQKARNFTFTLVRPPDGLWGYCPEPNNCSGMIGQVDRKEVDFAIGRSKITVLKFTTITMILTKINFPHMLLTTGITNHILVQFCQPLQGHLK